MAKNIAIPEELHRKLKILSAREGKSITSLVERILEEKLGEIELEGANWLEEVKNLISGGRGGEIGLEEIDGKVQIIDISKFLETEEKFRKEKGK